MKLNLRNSHCIGITSYKRLFARGIMFAAVMGSTLLATTHMSKADENGISFWMRCTAVD